MLVMQEIDNKGKDLVWPENFIVKFDADVFLNSRNIVFKHDFAIAIDDAGESRAIIVDKPCTYIHSYSVTGGLDLTFLDEYECLILNDCNEFSVELCVSALKLWKGEMLVFVGESWEPMIPYLPDLPGKACFYEKQLTSDREIEITAGKKTLHGVFGYPQEETMERYENGIMTYDEIMSFTYMFTDLREMGERNPDKVFFIVEGRYDNLGLFALFNKTVCTARYVKKKGYIPVVRLSGMENSIYQDYPNDAIWEKFYCQPQGYTVEEAMNSKNVFISPGFYNGSIQCHIMDRFSGDTRLDWVNGIYNREIRYELAEMKKKYLPYPEKTLGVLARGTDYVNTHLNNHSIHADFGSICGKIDSMMDDDSSYEYIYVSTEDAGYCEAFKKRYGDRLFCTDQQRYTVEPGEMLAQMHRRIKGERSGYQKGLDYIASIFLLSCCRSLIASGGCAGVSEALRENSGKYKQVYIFNLGKNAEV